MSQRSNQKVSYRHEACDPRFQDNKIVIQIETWRTSRADRPTDRYHKIVENTPNIENTH